MAWEKMKWIQLFLYVQSIRMQEFEMDEEETETMERNESSEIVNTQSLHNKSVLGLPWSVLHYIPAF